MSHAMELFSEPHTYVSVFLIAVYVKNINTSAPKEIIFRTQTNAFRKKAKPKWTFKNALIYQIQYALYHMPLHKVG